MSALVEPHVLAEAKSFLTNSNLNTGYAVVDSQFQVENWGEYEIPKRIQDKLRPINSLRLRGGEPDALLTPPRRETYRGGGESNDDLPLAVVEAKGETSSSNQNATRVAITQAHRHISEVNVGYAAVPQSYISQQDRALAREVNVGLLAVNQQGTELIERPRLVGAESSQTTDTIRFHARFGDSVVENLSKNHPKNALGYALALQSEDDTEQVFQRHVIESIDDGRRDAESLGLIRSNIGSSELTAWGREAVRTIVFHHESVAAALEQIEELYGKSGRFINKCPVMGAVARQTLLTYPPTQILVDEIEKLMAGGLDRPVLSQIAKSIARNRPDFALDLFVAGKNRGKVLESNGDLNLDAFDQGEVYSTHTTFQYKAMLYHTGILTERGTGKKSKIRPTDAVWELETPF